MTDLQKIFEKSIGNQYEAEWQYLHEFSLPYVEYFESNG